MNFSSSISLHTERVTERRGVYVWGACLCLCPSLLKQRDRTRGEKQDCNWFALSPAIAITTSYSLSVCVCVFFCTYTLAGWCVCVCSSTWMFSSWYSRSVLSVFSRSVWSRASCSPWVRRKMWVFWASICCWSFSCCGGKTAATSPTGPCDFATCASYNWLLLVVAPAIACSMFWHLLLLWLYKKNLKFIFLFWLLICRKDIHHHTHAVISTKKIFKHLKFVQSA